MNKIKNLIFGMITLVFVSYIVTISADEIVSPFTDSLPHLFDIKPEKPKLQEVVKDAQDIHFSTLKNRIDVKAQSSRQKSLLLTPQAQATFSQQEHELAELLGKLNDINNISDPCLKQIKNNINSKLAVSECQDHYLGNKLAPKMLVVNRVDAIPLVISKYYITQRDYALYCVLAGKCNSIKNITIKDEDFDNLENSSEIGIDLTDVEASINEYNKYCVVTGKCPGVFSEKKDKFILNLTIKQAQAYADWLSQVTGYSYRLPTEKEWLSVFNNATIEACHSQLDAKKIPKAIKSKKVNIQTQEGLIFSPFTIGEFTLHSLLDNTYRVLGPIEPKQISSCYLPQKKVVNNDYSEKQIGFHLVRALRFN